MPVLKIVNMAGKETGEITLSDAVFGAEVNATVLHTAVKAYLANQRQGTQSTLHVLRISRRQKAVAPERNRPCETGIHKISSMDTRWGCAWTETQKIQDVCQ